VAITPPIIKKKFSIMILRMLTFGSLSSRDRISSADRRDLRSTLSWTKW